MIRVFMRRDISDGCVLNVYPVRTIIWQLCERAEAEAS